MFAPFGARSFWRNTGELPLIQRQQVGSEIYFLVFDAQLGSDIVSMKLDGPGGKVAQLSDVFCGFTLFDEIGHLDFGGRKPQIFAGQAARKRGHDVFEIDFDDIDKGFFPVRQFAVF